MVRGKTILLPMTTPQAFALAQQHHKAGRLVEAEDLYRQILAVQPGHAEALHHYGIIAQQTGRHDLAIEWIGRALALQPDNPAAHSNLGEAYRTAGLIEEAIKSLQRAIQLRPDFPVAHFNLGNALKDQARLDEAIAAYRRALELKPDYLEALNNLGTTQRMRGDLDEAEAAFRAALRFQPQLLEAHNNLGLTLAEQGRLEEAVATYRHALRLNPKQPNVHSNLIYTLQFQPDLAPQIIAEERTRWNRQFSPPSRSPLPIQDTDPERRLRIGYVSPDLKDHVVGRNVRPLFQHHDHQHFEILCYAGVPRPDSMTAEFRQHADHWRSTVGLDDAALAEMIRRDSIDILVDLAQHTSGNRLAVLARHPAPLQVSFAGYPASAGLDAIGHRISDRYLESEIEDGRSKIASDLRSAERVFLLDSFWCYDPCGVALPIQELAARNTGRITFGSLNNFTKINPSVLKLWARVLAEVKGSRLLLLSPRGSHRERTLDTLAREGVAVERVEFVELRSRQAYLELYHRLDVALDPFPYNGHTTSLDALWMGVPVVSLIGSHSLARGGFSQLSNLGLPELAATSEDDYVRIAANLAHDLPRLTELRRTLRSRMEASPLMDARGFTKAIETTYRSLWRRWRAENNLPQ